MVLPPPLGEHKPSPVLELRRIPAVLRQSLHCPLVAEAGQVGPLPVTRRLDRRVPLRDDFFPVHRTSLARLPHFRYRVAMERETVDPSLLVPGKNPLRPIGPCAKCRKRPKMKGAGYCRRCKSTWDTERRKYFRQRAIELEKENEALRARVALYELRLAVSASAT